MVHQVLFYLLVRFDSEKNERKKKIKSKLFTIPIFFNAKIFENILNFK